MENNNEKELIIKAIKVAVCCGLGFWAAGPIGAMIGLCLVLIKF